MINRFSMKAVCIIGAALAILGSFLPWEVWGDFAAVWLYGIQIKPTWVDNGGVLIVCLGVMILGLTIWPLRFFKTTISWLVIVSSILSGVAVYHLGAWLVRRIQHGSMIGATSIQIGLELVCLGATLTLVGGIGRDRRKTAA